MNRSCRNSREKKSNEKKQRAEQKNSALFFVQKNPLPRMIAEMGAGARPCLKIEHDLIENALQIFLSAA